jgi:type I restriction enzyme S subunit
MINWKTKKLSEVCEKITDGTHQTPKYFNEGVIFLSSKNVTSGKIDWGDIKYIDEKQHLEMHKRVAPKVDDILLAKNGTTGVAAKVDKDVVFDIYVSLALLRPLEVLHPDYLLHFINSPLAKKQFNKRLKGIGVPNLHLEEIREVEIPLPPLPEQQRIVSILDKAFAAISKAKSNAEQNLKNAHELFESYLQGVFENKGEGWENVRFEDLCKLTRGHNPPKSKFIAEPKKGYVRFYQIRDGWADDYAVYVPDTPQLHKVEPDEILMVAYRHIGKVYRGVSGAFNVALCKISNRDSKRLNNDFLFYIIPTDIIKGKLMKRSERSLIPSMSVEHLKEILIPLPPFNEQENIVHKLDTLRAETKKLEAIYQKKIEDLEEMKKSILQKAFAGELKT